MLYKITVAAKQDILENCCNTYLDNWNLTVLFQIKNLYGIQSKWQQHSNHGSIQLSECELQTFGKKYFKIRLTFLYFSNMYLPHIFQITLRLHLPSCERYTELVVNFIPARENPILPRLKMRGDKAPAMSEILNWCWINFK